MLSKEEIESHIDLVKLPQYKANSTEKALVEYIDQLESDKQKLIEKLEKDIVNITKTMKYGNHYDDYRRCRLKAYRTKTKEILEIVKGVENERDKI